MRCECRCILGTQASLLLFNGLGVEKASADSCLVLVLRCTTTFVRWVFIVDIGASNTELIRGISLLGVGRRCLQEFPVSFRHPPAVKMGVALLLPRGITVFRIETFLLAPSEWTSFCKKDQRICGHARNYLEYPDSRIDWWNGTPLWPPNSMFWVIFSELRSFSPCSKCQTVTGHVPFEVRPAVTLVNKRLG
jgi:hypothetical protein